MQPKNFKDMIFAELTASNDYMKKAIDSMKSYPKWSSIFKTMSDDRFYHAEILYNPEHLVLLKIPHHTK